MSRKAIHVPKPLAMRVGELIKSLYVLRDSIEAYSQGASHQLIPLYGQLRALLTDRSGNSPPLLLDIADELGQDLEFYVTRPISQPPSAQSENDQSDSDQEKSNSEDTGISREDLLFAMGGFYVTTRKQFENQVLMPVEDFVDQPILAFRGETYTVREIITFFANRAGGAHYSTRVKKDLADALQVGFAGQRTLHAAMRQIGEATLVAGRQLLRRVAEFDFHLGLFVDEHDQDENAFLIDSQYPRSPMYLRAFLDPMDRLHFGVTGIDGTSTQVVTDRIVNWDEPHDFSFRLRINNDLSTRLTILAEGEEWGTTKINRAIFLPADPLHYDTYINRSHDDATSRLSFCLAHLTVLRGADVSPYEQAERLLHFRSKAKSDAKCIYISDDTTGRMPSGTKDLRFRPDARSWNYDKMRDDKTPTAQQED